MYKKTLTLTLVMLPLTSYAESAENIIDRMVEAEAANIAGVNTLYIRSTTLGHVVHEFFERDGDYLRPLPMADVLERQQPNEMAAATPADLERAALELRMQSGVVDAAFRDEIAKSGVAGNMGGLVALAQNPEKPWLTTSPGGMMNLYATMLEGGAASKRQRAAEEAAFSGEMAANQEMIDSLKSDLRLLGRREVDGTDVIEIGADGLNVVQESPEGNFVMEQVRILVDADNYLTRQFRISGTLTQGKESRPMTIERIDSRFLPASNCAGFVKPVRSVMRMGGALTPEQEAQIIEAQAQLTDLKKQLASMPKAQQDMMKNMMGPQLEMIENMAQGGGIEIVSEIDELRCNQPWPTAEELAGDVF